MKTKYISPYCEVLELENDDILTQSPFFNPDTDEVGEIDDPHASP